MSRKPVAYSITGAPKSRTADVRSREVRYLISMAIRTACFIGAFVTHGVFRWVLIVAAVLLPYIAVVIANAGRERTKSGPAPYVPEGRLELPSGGSAAVHGPGNDYHRTASQKADQASNRASNQGRSSGEDLSSPH
ncbi:DUF3099 domain-containing protein [Flindersiella endophytica]